MILVDTSVWIEHLRYGEDRLYRQDPRLAGHEGHAESSRSRLGIHKRPVSYVRDRVLGCRKTREGS